MTDANKILGWRESDWPEWFDRRTANALADWATGGHVGTTTDVGRIVGVSFENETTLLTVHMPNGGSWGNEQVTVVRKARGAAPQ